MRSEMAFPCKVHWVLEAAELLAMLFVSVFAALLLLPLGSEASCVFFCFGFGFPFLLCLVLRNIAQYMPLN